MNQQCYRKIISGSSKGFLSALLRLILRILSLLYSPIIRLRNVFYDKQWLKTNPVDAAVISIGNITAGGTGKTPIVEIFARSLQQSGRKVAILSRGYKKAEIPFSEKVKNFITFNTPKQQPPRVVSDGERLLLDSEMGGDEPYMLASNLPKACVLVDKDRVKSSRYAIQKMGCDTLILDDGFQYLRLQHRVDIVLVDRTNPFDNGYVLPRGLLRESVKHLSRATFIFITKSPGDGSEELRKQIRELNDKAVIA